MAALVQALTQALGHNRVPIPQFAGSSIDDPHLFKQKARDFMDDSQVPDTKWTHKFRLFLEGEARDWYNDLAPVPADWDTLMELFCKRFCVFGQTEEDWHDAWSRLAFDKATDNIDKFINKVKRLARQLRFRDQSILIKLKQLFPEKADTWLVVHDLDEMCGYLKKIYSPYNLRQVDPTQAAAPSTAAPGSASPFMASPMHSDPYHLRVTTQDRRVHFDDSSLLRDSINNLNNSIQRMNRMPQGNHRNDHNQFPRPPKPYKPYIMKGRGRNFGRSCNRDRNRHDNSCPRQNSDSSHSRDRSWNRPPPCQYDCSPTTRKPRTNSKTIDKDKDRCFNCHQHGHFARECPQTQNDLIRAMRELRLQSSDPSGWPEFDVPSNSDPELDQPLN